MKTLYDWATYYESLFEEVLTGIQNIMSNNDSTSAPPPESSPESSPETCMEKVFFNQMKNLFESHPKGFSFLTYLSFYNFDLTGNKGDIKFYYTTSPTKYYNSEKELKEYNEEVKSLLEKYIGIGKRLRDKEKFGESFSYYYNKENTYWVVLKDDKYFYRKGEGKNEVLKDLIPEKSNKEFAGWLIQLHKCYKDTDVFFYCSGPIYYYAKDESEGSKELSKFVVSASAGIKIGDNDIEKIQGFIKQFKRFIEQLSFNIIVDIKDFQTHQTAVRASIAQVMARNMSHNIGSHVFSNLIYDDAYDNVKDKKINCLTSYTSFLDPDDVFNDSTKNLQLAYFNQYLKSRMDYLSEVTFGIPVMLTSKMVKSELFKELDRVRILLNYISGIKSFNYTFKILRNGKEIEEDFAAAFPSGVLGCQAFYNIIENIIRNTAKHAKSTHQNKPIEFTIDFKDIPDEVADYLNHPEEISELFCVEIDNGICKDKEEIDKIVESQNKRINESVLVSNRLRNKNLGLLEMEASAAFLRQIDMPDIESDCYWIDQNNCYYNQWEKLNILKAINKDNKLAYRFFVQRPKEFLFVGKWELYDANEKDLKQTLRQQGIRFIDDNELSSPKESFPQQFLIYDYSIKPSKTKDWGKSTLLPLRQLHISKNEQRQLIVDLKNVNPIAKLKCFAWKKYYKGLDIDNWKIEADYDSGWSNTIAFVNHGETFASWKTSASSQKNVYFENLNSRTWGKLPMWEKYSEKKKRTEPDNRLFLYSSHLNQLFEGKNKDESLQIKRELVEAYCSKVIAIDERIQKFAEETENDIRCQDLYQWTNVHVPEAKEIPLDPDKFDNKTIENLEQFINKNINDAFLLIHYGILERIYKGNGDTIKVQLRGWASKAKRVVVTSGRGAHSIDLPDEVCFVNLSSVQYAFIENRNKYLINYLLYQTRRKGQS